LEEKKYILPLPRANIFLAVRQLSPVTVPTLEYFGLSGICCGGIVIVVVYQHCRHYGLVIFGVIPFTLH
jgi:hypothetical protein